MRDIGAFEKAAALLPPDIRREALALPEPVRDACEELRLRSGRPCAALWTHGEQTFGPALRPGELDSVLESATRASAHTALAASAAGYVPVRGGLRLELCGEAVVKDGRCAGIRRISSLCLRIPHSVPGCADGVYPALARGGFTDTLIIFPPGAGKTTLLRELVRRLSDAGERVGLADERGEVAGVWESESTFDVGSRTDIMTGAPRADAAMMLLRSMTPQIIAMDEITAAADIDAVLAASGCGVRLLATAHGADAAGIAQRALYGRLLGEGVFRRAVVIERGADGKRRYRVEEFT